MDASGNVPVRQGARMRKMLLLCGAGLVAAVLLVAVPIDFGGGSNNSDNSASGAASSSDNTNSNTDTNTATGLSGAGSASTTQSCTRVYDGVLDCSNATSRRLVSESGACAVASVVECCCDEFYALELVLGSIAVSRNTTELQFGDVQYVGGDVVVPGSYYDTGVLVSAAFEALQFVGGDVQMVFNHVTQVSTGQLTNLNGSLLLAYNDITSFDFGGLSIVNGDVDLSNNALTTIDFGALTRVEGDVDLAYNRLTNIDTFARLRTIAGRLDLSSNRLTKLVVDTLPNTIDEGASYACNAVSRLDWSGVFSTTGLCLAGNDLTSLELGYTRRIDGSLNLEDNDIASIDFGFLTTIDGSLVVSNNDLAAVDMFSLASVTGSLRISGNPSLVAFDCSDVGECVCPGFKGPLTRCPAFCATCPTYN
ncbi:hypothetical protein PTSG_10282 [Salpingoeca rosetta]|uniref:Receptor L-domain domain-containing protein n=1 Tax=Salpingoeca rosetta (strain ATCC 50818 / BSB-021) TaxID=946362 RepID=F2UQV1_SALR5|nr:uncharacterized protein PTSG_10282 [Salpingoeca rosetta]EGD80006.1 hypothetical protein PTSG_10282 [Salpingoeca rosetta]|eukprot:XP_004988331.1 hypothetical protein PTSG_10282 [Salpingoeca rosetta]